MTKILLILTAAALLAAAVFGVQNRTAYIEDRKNRLANNKEMDGIWDQITDEESGEIVMLTKAHDRLYAAEELLAQHQADLEQTRNGIATLNTEINALQAKMRPLDAEISKAEQAVAELREKFPGVNLENIGSTIKQLESDLDDKKQELAAKQAEVEIVNKKVTSNQNIIKNKEEAQQRRLAAVRNNSLEGTITAVNNDWGFAVANLGSNAGIKGDTELIIKRGQQRIGTLGVVSVQTNVSVLNIKQKSLSGTVQPGDRVIFERVSR